MNLKLKLKKASLNLEYNLWTMVSIAKMVDNVVAPGNRPQNLDLLHYVLSSFHQGTEH